MHRKENNNERKKITYTNEIREIHIITNERNYTHTNEKRVKAKHEKRLRAHGNEGKS